MEEISFQLFYYSYLQIVIASKKLFSVKKLIKKLHMLFQRFNPVFP